MYRFYHLSLRKKGSIREMLILIYISFYQGSLFHLGFLSSVGKKDQFLLVPFRNTSFEAGRKAKREGGREEESS